MVEIIAQNYTEKSITSESIPFIGMGGGKIFKRQASRYIAQNTFLGQLVSGNFAAGINPKFSCGALMGGDKQHDAPPTNSVDIPFDLFCIDDMRESSRLKIMQKE